MQPKFKVGDVVEVIREGSAARVGTRFVVGTISSPYDDYGLGKFIYWPKDAHGNEKNGAWENHLILVSGVNTAKYSMGKNGVRRVA